MATTNYNMGGPLGPDSRFVDDLDAIDTYVRTIAHPAIAKYPNSASVVADYDVWRQGLGWSDMNVFPNDTMTNAKAKRSAINIAQGNTLPNTAVVEPGSYVTPPKPKTSFGDQLAAAGSGVKLIAYGIFIGLGIWAYSQIKSNSQKGKAKP